MRLGGATARQCDGCSAAGARRVPFHPPDAPGRCRAPSEAAHLTPDRERGCRARWALQHLSLHVLRQPSSAAPPAWLPRNPPPPDDLHQPEPSGPGPGLSPLSPSPGDLIIPLSCISVDDPRLYFPTSDPFLSFIVECPPVSLGRRHRGVA